MPLLQKWNSLHIMCDNVTMAMCHVNCGDDLPVLEQTDDGDASFDNNNYGTDVSYVLIL